MYSLKEYRFLPIARGKADGLFVMRDTKKKERAVFRSYGEVSSKDFQSEAA